MLSGPVGCGAALRLCSHTAVFDKADMESFCRLSSGGTCSLLCIASIALQRFIRAGGHNCNTLREPLDE